jgi:hypothetical protein
MATKAKKGPATESVEEQKPTSALTTPPATNGAMVDWEEEMQREAAAAAKMEQNAGGGQFFSIKGGILSFAEAPIPNNEMAVVILDSILENVYYTADYDPDDPQGPACFAFGRDEKEMVPHEVVFANGTQQSEKCETCPWNQWASADKGKGKACKNARRLALVGAGTFDKNGVFTMDTRPLSYSDGPVGFLRIPVTSVKGYAMFVKRVASVLGRPPYGVVTKVKVSPHPKHQVELSFEVLEKVPAELMPVVMARAKEARGTIDFPYQVGSEPEEAPSPKKAARTPAGVKAAAKAAPVKGRAPARAPARAAKY